MCGISAVIVKPGKEVDKSVLTVMTDIISHRGPDDSGFEFFLQSDSWNTVQAGHWQVGFGHRRLSIIDLSPMGHQPMSYRGNYWITFNGEIYNYIELRESLKKQGYEFKSSSDTEVILAAYAAWGTKSFSMLKGMWSFALFDQEKNQIVLCRDRLGIKPLYYTDVNSCVAISSEIKQFLKIPGFRPKLNMSAAVEWCQTGYENYNRTFFQNVSVVEPGTYVTVDVNAGTVTKPIPYWSPKVEPQVLSREEAAGIFKAKFERSVQEHLRSDVPVACALSGGLDSSTVALVMNKLNPVAFHTFSTTFPGNKLNEEPFIREVLNKTQAVAHFNNPSSAEFREHVNDFIWHNDEPPVAFSPFASFMLARTVQQASIKVTLNGQGGDEILGGYWQNYLAFLRSSLKGLNVLDFLKHSIGSITPGGNGELVSQMFYYASRINGKRNFVIPWVLKTHQESSGFLKKYLELDSNERRLFELRYLILPKLLKYDDRNTMAFSVEGRYPFLDHELIEFCLNLSPNALYHRGWTKQPIRIGFQNVLPQAITKRKTKWGYPVPQYEWIVELKDYYQAWVKNKSRPIWGLIPQSYCAGMLQEIISGKRTDHEVFVRLHLLDLWLEIFSIEL